MPPTKPAATITASGKACAMKRSTSCDCRRSSSRRGAVTTSQSSPCSRRRIAEPTMPAWPATNTRLPLRSKMTGAPLIVVSFAEIAMGTAAANVAQIRFDHLAHQIVESDGVAPAELLARLAGIADQRVGLGRPEVARIDLDLDAAVARIDALFGKAGAAPFDAPADAGKGL